MTLEEFKSKYYLHDSFIERMYYSADNSTLTLVVNFAFWMQNNYMQGDDENGLIEVTFYDVSNYECKHGDPTGDFVGILDAQVANNTLTLSLLDDETGDYLELNITSTSVEVKII